MEAAEKLGSRVIDFQIWWNQFWRLKELKILSGTCAVEQEIRGIFQGFKMDEQKSQGLH